MNPKEPVKAIVHSDALVILTDWPEYRDLDYAKIAKLMNSPNLVDGKNLLQPEELRSLGFTYRGMGLR